MSKPNNEGKPVILNTPAGFNFQKSFEGHSIKFKPKVEFLIHQINYYDKQGGYQIHSKNHQWFFGIKGTELAMMLRKLVEIGLIKLAANYHPGNTSNTYRMVIPFDVKAQDTQQSFYYAHQVLFVKKWILDGYIVMNASTTSFIKELKTTVNAAKISAQQKQINDLQAQVLVLLGQTKIGIQDGEKINNSDIQKELSLFAPSSDLTTLNNIKDVKDVEISQSGELPSVITDTIKPLTNKNLEYVNQAPCNGQPDDIEANTLKVQANLTGVNSIDDAQEMNELAELFCSSKSLSPSVRNLSLIDAGTSDNEAAAFKESVISLPKDLSKNKVGDDGSTDDQIPLTSAYTPHYIDDMLIIECGLKSGTVLNFNDIKSWCLPLSNTDKTRFFYQLMSSTGSSTVFMLNPHTKVKFKRREEEGHFFFNYEALLVA